MGDNSRDRGQEGAWVLFWDNSDGELRIHPRQPDWDPADQAGLDFALQVIDGDVPLDAWVSLAQEFLRRVSS
jgi:hypothetical protein